MNAHRRHAIQMRFKAGREKRRHNGQPLYPHPGSEKVDCRVSARGSETLPYTLPVQHILCAAHFATRPRKDMKSTLLMETPLIN